MTVNQTSTVVGVFRDRAQADQAMNALNSAGFDRSQIRFAGPGTKGNFLEDIKNLFAGPNASGGNIVGDLTGMGLSDEEAQYYAKEHNNGNIVVAVKTPGREQEVLNVLHSYNAYNYKDNPASGGPASHAQQPSYTGQDRYAISNEDTVVQESHAQYPANEQQPYATARGYNQNAMAAASGQTFSATPDNDQATQPDVVTTSGNQQPYPTTNTGRPSAEPQPGVATNERDTEFQNIQAQIQAVQQQLQEARAQLQSAKQREAQVRSTKEEHEKRLQDSKQQLQDIQSELQNTLAELRNTQTRIGQYK